MCALVTGVQTCALPISPAVEQAAFPADFGVFVDFVEGQGGFKLAHHLRDDVGVIRYAPPEIVLKAESPHLADLPRNLAASLKEWTRTSWLVSYGEGEAAPSIREQEAASAERARAEILAHPMVKAATDRKSTRLNSSH